MKEKFELVPRGEHSYKIKYVKKHWWSRWKVELDSNTNTPKIYPVNQENCVHHLEFSHIAEYYYRPIPLRIYRCTKCGIEVSKKKKFAIVLHWLGFGFTINNY